MKKSLLCLSLGLLVAGGVQAQTLYSEDFNATTGTSMPTGWTANPTNPVSWITGTQASAGSTYFAPPDLDGRYAIINDDADSSIHNTNSVMTSQSYDLSSQTGIYASMDVAYLGASGTLPSGTAVAEKLTFEASTDGGNTWNVLKTFSGANSWTTYYIDLSSVAGQSNVEFAWRYNDDNQWMYGAAVDNFKIFKAATNDIQLVSVSPVQGDAGAYGQVGHQVTISGSVFNNGATPITSYTVNYQQGSNPVVSTTETGNIAPFGTGSFSNVTYNIPSIGDFPIKVWVSLNGDNNPSNDSANAYVEGVSFMPTKHLVFEEATGTWCGWCPRGSYNMKLLRANHPGAATQIAVHDDDPMTISAYDNFITTLPGFTGFPTVVVDRSVLIDPGDMETTYQQMKNNFGFASVTMGTPSVSGSTVSVSVDIKPAVDISGAKLAFVVTEDGVTGTGSTWGQHNYYAGGQSGQMGGYENLPSVINDEVYEFVARAVSPSPAGDASGLPSSMTAGGDYTATLSATLDPSWNQDSLHYAVLLIGSNGQILNSDFSGSTTSISNVVAGLNNAVIYPNPTNGDNAFLNVTAKNATDAVVTVTDLAGRTLNTIPFVHLQGGQNLIKVPTNGLANGMYMVTLKTEKGNINLKLQILK